MARLHNCMPVILARALEEAWLDPALTQAQDVLDVLSRSTGLKLDAYPVSRMANRPSLESELLIERVRLADMAPAHSWVTSWPSRWRIPSWPVRLHTDSLQANMARTSFTSVGS
jgi:hypothetical protein